MRHSRFHWGRPRGLHRPRWRHALSALEAVLASGALLASTAHAQPFVPTQVGIATQRLLQQQADGSQAGAALSLEGPVAAASYKRYLDSFAHPIPPYLEQRLDAHSSR